MTPVRILCTRNHGHHFPVAALSVLRSLESKLAGLVEGTFSRAFKSEVRPVEIARKLAREMDEHNVQSLSRVYAPNEYAVWLSPDDRKQFEGYEDELARELAGYLLEHARRERIALVTSPQISSRPTSGCGSASSASRRDSCARPRTSKSSRARATRATRWSTRFGARVGAAARAGSRARARAPARRAAGRRSSARGGAVLGRSRDCDVVLDDPNVSRHHAEVRPSGGSWIVNDLGSTNGIKVNGRRVDGPESLKPGDVDRTRHVAA